MATASLNRLSRRERELNLRKEIVLEAAEEVFAAKGYYEAAVEEIASRAGVSIGTFYNLFASKEALYILPLSHSLTEVRSHVRCLTRGEGTFISREVHHESTSSHCQ